jgi:predicted flap endonuclease-1-like 5' DNA nuclease
MIWADSRPESWCYEELLKQYPTSDFVNADPVYGVIYLERPSGADNLTQIRGIDAGTAESLRRAGVQRFRQIADWSEANVDAFTTRLRLVPGRIYTERWIPQANDLCDGAPV